MVALVVALGQANSVVSVVVALALGTVRTRASTPLLGPSNTRKRATPQMLSLLSYTGSSAVAVLWMEMLSFLMRSFALLYRIFRGRSQGLRVGKFLVKHRRPTIFRRNGLAPIAIAGPHV